MMDIIIIIIIVIIILVFIGQLYMDYKLSKAIKDKYQRDKQRGRKIK